MRTPLAVYLEEASMPEPNSGCWLWLRGVNNYGYGVSTHPEAGSGAHRAAWAAYKGTIPAGQHVLHKCDVRSCINPDHLFLGDQLANMRDKMGKGRHVSHPGEKHGRARLKESEVIAIRNADGTARNLAKAYGVSPSLISLIRSGRRWKHTLVRE